MINHCCRDNTPQFMIEGDRIDIPESEKRREEGSQTSTVQRREKYPLYLINHRSSLQREYLMSTHEIEALKTASRNTIDSVHQKKMFKNRSSVKLNLSKLTGTFLSHKYLLGKDIHIKISNKASNFQIVNDNYANQDLVIQKVSKSPF